MRPPDPCTRDRGPAAALLPRLGILLAGVAACGPPDPAAPEPAAERASTAPAEAPTGAPPRPERPDLGFPDEAGARGLDYVNRSGGPAKATILEANGAGVALLDLGGDGDLDVVFAQGLPSLAAAVEGPGADLEVFENDGGGRFTRLPGPGLSGWWTGLATGDVDGDGDTDLVAGGYGALRLLLQDEHGRLIPAPASDLMPGPPQLSLVPGEEREPGTAPLWVSSLALFDADRDGALDLFVGQYLELDPLAPPLGALGEPPLSVPCRWKGHPVYCGPSGLTPQPDRLLRGDGTGRFSDRTAEWLVGAEPAFTLAVAPYDADGDGDTDLYVANDSAANRLFVNDGRGRMTDYALAAGVALSPDGRAEAGMGVAFGDVNRDGLVDFAVTNFSGEPTALYFGARIGFENHTHRVGLMRETRELLSWGVHLVDFDGDGWLELFTANGHVYPQADLERTGTRYGQRDSLWRLNAGELTAVQPLDERSVLAPETGTRGSAVGDVDGDGAPDLVLVRLDGPAALGMNRSGPLSHRLALRCLGPAWAHPVDGAAEGRTPTDGRGTRVALVLDPEVGGGEQVVLLGEVQTSVGYQSASTPWLHFGLGPRASYRSIQIRWPSGRVDDLGPGAADRRLVVREGEGLVSDEVLP